MKLTVLCPHWNGSGCALGHKANALYCAKHPCPDKPRPAPKRTQEKQRQERRRRGSVFPREFPEVQFGNAPAAAVQVSLDPSLIGNRLAAWIKSFGVRPPKGCGCMERQEALNGWARAWRNLLRDIGIA